MGVVVVIVELDKEIIKLSTADDYAHVRFRNWTLWSAGNVILMTRI